MKILKNHSFGPTMAPAVLQGGARSGQGPATKVDDSPTIAIMRTPQKANCLLRGPSGGSPKEGQRRKPTKVGPPSPLGSATIVRRK